MRRLRRKRRGYGTIRFEIPPYRRRKFITLMTLGIFLVSLSLTIWLVDARLRPVLRQLALSRAKVLATAAVNQAVANGEARQIKYQDLVAVRADREGRPVLLQPNTGELNRLAASIILDVQRSLNSLERSKVRLPMGQVLGPRVLGSWGPQINVNFLPVGTVEGRIVDSFTTAGINQTRHRIAIRIETQVRVVVPLVSASTRIQTDVPLAEAVIVGEVPGVHLDGVQIR